MKNYCKTNYSSFDEFKTELEAELQSRFAGKLVTHIRYGNGIIETIKLADLYIDTFDEDQEFDFKFTFKFADGFRTTYILSTILKNGIVQFNQDTYNDLKNLYKEFAKSFSNRKEELKLAIVNIYEEERQEKLRLEAEAKAKRDELKLQTRKERAIAKLKTIKPEDTKANFEEPTTYYEVLGWMAKHCISIRAAMPDWMEKQFVAMFGDVERYVVNSKKKTSGGFDYQWGLGLKISFDREVICQLAAKATSKNKKIIDSVEFIWDLVENYGFQFGKEQDVDKIIDEVPNEYLTDFERGFTL